MQQGDTDRKWACARELSSMRHVYCQIWRLSDGLFCKRLRRLAQDPLSRSSRYADVAREASGLGADLEEGCHRRRSAHESPSSLGRRWPSRQSRPAIQWIATGLAFYALSVDELSLPHDYSSTDGRSSTVTYRAILSLDGMANVRFSLETKRGGAHSIKNKFIRGLTNVLRAMLGNSQFLRSMTR
jgi:hypothetical protein